MAELNSGVSNRLHTIPTAVTKVQDPSSQLQGRDVINSDQFVAAVSFSLLLSPSLLPCISLSL